MFYKTDGNRHGLPHNPFKSCIVPRPIGWISSQDRQGRINLAPYSFFNGVAADPPMVMFSSNGRQPHGAKDTITNCEETGEFVVNMATWALRDQMNVSSGPHPAEADEMALAGLEAEASELVRPPRVKAAPVHLECLTHQIVELPCDVPGDRNAMVLGRVIGIHIRDDALTDGLIDIEKLQPIARLGYRDYTRVQSVFTMLRPGQKQS